ncbi:MAG: bifunctional phosphoserine phosphatase/homoserine phosphotransferase ThrH [Spirochaetes bacterium]|nr:bifunctional phosphoserine phosphatase/homoserine phosphotransferase ThrH [Spirochaetota bacterium]
MHIVCLDLEGVLIPEIWIAVSKAAGLDGLARTTREEADYDKLMKGRLDILAANNLRLADLQAIVKGMEPLEGALDFVRTLRGRVQFVLLSDTFDQFARGILEKLNWPTLFCNTLEVAPDGVITGYKIRQQDGKRCAVRAFKSINARVFAAGDSFNDLSMLREADAACLFRAPQAIVEQCPDLAATDSFDGLLEKIDVFLQESP